MIKQSDIEGRLRLFRYGLIVIVVVAFIVSLLAPTFALRGLGAEAPPLTDFLGNSILITVVVAVIAVVAYFAYRELLKRTVNPEGGDNKEKAG